MNADGAVEVRLNTAAVERLALSSSQLRQLRQTLASPGRCTARPRCRTRFEHLCKCNPGHGPELFELVGPPGARAWIEDNEIHMTDSPRFKDQEAISWVRKARRILKPYLTVDFDVKSPGRPFRRIVAGKPGRDYSEVGMEERSHYGKVWHPITLRRVSALQARRPPGPQSDLLAYLNKRNMWIRQRYDALRTKGLSRSKAIETIQNKLLQRAPKTFGPYAQGTNKRNPHVLSDDTLLRIISHR